MRWLATVVTVSLVTACGGGGGGGDSLFEDDDGGGGSSGPTVSSVDVISSLPEVQTGGAPITITAIVKGAGNVSLPNTPVQFATDTGTLTDAVAITDDAGVATAMLRSGTDPTNRIATVTVTAGDKSGSVTVGIVGTKIALSGPTTLQLNENATLSAKLTDGAGNPLANVPVTAESRLGNLGTTPGNTNGQGVVSIDYTAANSGTDTVTVAAAGATSTPLQIIVSGQDFAFTSPAANSSVPVGTSKKLSVRYRVNGVAQTGVAIRFTSTAGKLSPASAVATTNASGVATISISADTASPATVQASLPNGAGSATLPIEFVATQPAALVLQVTPTAIAPNAAGSTTNQAQVIARVTDANGNPVKGQTVNFSRDLDPSGGNLSQPSGVTDSSGQATAQYVSGLTSTASNGVVLRATVSGTSVTDTATLTVSQSALFIGLGTGNTISNIDDQTYKKDYTVYVTDANSVAVPNVTLTVKALPTRYSKGSLAYNGTVWTASEVSEGSSLVDSLGNLLPGLYVACTSEDRKLGDNDARSFNGVLDTGEDVNGNDLLEPGNVISVTPGTLRTDSNGRATLSLIYAESYAPWVEIRLQVQAVVSGTASTTESIFFVRGSAADFSSERIPPAGVDSPFGFKPTCAQAN